MTHIKKIFSAILFSFIFSNAYAKLDTQTRLIIFGDSLSDAGMNVSEKDQGNNTWKAVPGAVGAPITSIDPDTNTRPLWANLITPTRHILPYRIAQLTSTWKGDIDFAFGSAETNEHYLNDNTGTAYPPYVDANCYDAGNLSPGIYCVPGVLKQIDLYLTKAHDLNRKTIFIIWGGGNDIFDNIAKLISLFKKNDFSTFLTQLINTISLSSSAIKNDSPLFPELSHPVLNLIEAKNKLIAAGVSPEQIYFIDLPDLSKTPAAVTLANGSDFILDIIHGITVLFNGSLKFGLTQFPFQTHLSPSHIISAYDLLNDTFSHPEKFHFTHLIESCVADKKTPYCEGYIFFNNKHPTVAIEKLLADKINETI